MIITYQVKYLIEFYQTIIWEVFIYRIIIFVEKFLMLLCLIGDMLKLHSVIKDNSMLITIIY